jgi:hypothetical protein
MQTKTDQICAAWATGDSIGALRIAARFFDRSTDTQAMKGGMNACGARWWEGGPSSFC